MEKLETFVQTEITVIKFLRLSPRLKIFESQFDNCEKSDLPNFPFYQVILEAWRIFVDSPSLSKNIFNVYFKRKKRKLPILAKWGGGDTPIGKRPTHFRFFLLK